jgi:hypothetical protein
MRDLNTTIAQFLEQKITLFLEAYRANEWHKDTMFINELEELLCLLRDYLNWWENIYYKHKENITKEEKKAERRMLSLFKKVFPKLWY